MTDKMVSMAEAKECLAHDRSPTLAAMIAEGLPLSRDTFIIMAYGTADNWNHEKEAELPECFQDEQACAEMIAESTHSDEED